PTRLNALAGSEVFVDPKLFATLDPTTRRIELPNGRPILLTDTVGFIRKLPTHLVAAFRATLEEMGEAELLLHVVDASHPRMREQIEAVFMVLQDLGVAGPRRRRGSWFATGCGERARIAACASCPSGWRRAICSC